MLKWILIALITAFCGVLHAQPLRIAVAANAQFVGKALQADFKKKTGIESEIIVGSSGNLTTQIKNGAPYDVFLSADMEFPNLLYREKFAITMPKEYALGSLILCTMGQFDLSRWQDQISKDAVRKVAIANPDLAPYGKAAQQAMQHYGLWNKLQKKLVLGESISQVNTYVTTGVAEFGFTTEALVYEPGKGQKMKWVRVDRSIYDKIRQGIVLLSYSRRGNYEKAMKFYNYIFSLPAKQIFKNYGYQVL